MGSLLQRHNSNALSETPPSGNTIEQPVELTNSEHHYSPRILAPNPMILRGRHDRSGEESQVSHDSQMMCR